MNDPGPGPGPDSGRCSLEREEGRERKRDREQPRDVNKFSDSLSFPLETRQQIVRVESREDARITLAALDSAGRGETAGGARRRDAMARMSGNRSP